MQFFRYLLVAISLLTLAAAFMYVGMNNPIPLFGKEYHRPRFVRILFLLLAGVLLGISLRIIWLLPMLQNA